MEEKEEEVIINVYYSIIHTYMYIVILVQTLSSSYLSTSLYGSEVRSPDLNYVVPHFFSFLSASSSMAKYLESLPPEGLGTN